MHRPAGQLFVILCTSLVNDRLAQAGRPSVCDWLYGFSKTYCRAQAGWPSVCDVRCTMFVKDLIVHAGRPFV